MKIKLILLTLVAFGSIGLVHSKTVSDVNDSRSAYAQPSFETGTIEKPVARPSLGSSSDSYLSASDSLSADEWGAFAYSFSTGAYGFSYDHDTQQEAINAAVDECDADDCKAQVWFRNSCGAFANATGDDPGYGWGIGNDKDEASAVALSECRKRGTGCKLIKWVCTTR
jgi:serine/threonine-protein kinase